eukprot:gene12268-biopygen7460
MQVYQDLNVLSARPSSEEQEGVPHLLFGHVDGAINYSVGKWLDDAKAALETVRMAGKLPIFVGGTGMYFKALTQGLSDIPDVPDEIRQTVRAAAEGQTSAMLHQKLAALDPIMATKLRPSDPQRMLRAIEVFCATGRSLAYWQGQRGAALLNEVQAAWFIAPERPELMCRIEARFIQMMDNGALTEVEQLAARGLDPALPVMRAHGVPGLIEYLQGKTTRAAAILRGQMDTRHYAKRQFTFARHQLPEFKWLPTAAMPDLEIEQGLGAELAPGGPQPDVLNYAWRDYGNRVGAWRMIDLLNQFALPSSVLLNSDIYAQCPGLAEAFRARGDEIVGHGRTNSERQGILSEIDEGELIAEATKILTEQEGKAPKGWLGPWISESRATPDLLKQAGYDYVLDWCMDDQPIWMRTQHGPLLSVPYPQEINDIPMIVARKIEGPAFAQMIIDNFDEMLEQSANQPLVMGIALHPYIVGQPHRLRHLRRALAHIAAKRNDIWLTTAGDIAAHIKGLAV